jgi:predicted RNA-binding Zn-ribbon protein involved in translation (DUF1610 family)
MKIPFVCSERARPLLAYRKGDVDLMPVRGKWYVAIVYDVPDPEKVGMPVVAIDPHNTRRACPECGSIRKANRKTQQTFSCTDCGYTAAADFGGARNIRAFGDARVTKAPPSSRLGMRREGCPHLKPRVRPRALRRGFGYAMMSGVS